MWVRSGDPESLTVKATPEGVDLFRATTVGLLQVEIEKLQVGISKDTGLLVGLELRPLDAGVPGEQECLSWCSKKDGPCNI